MRQQDRLASAQYYHRAALEKKPSQRFDSLFKMSLPQPTTPGVKSHRLDGMPNNCMPGKVHLCNSGRGREHKMKLWFRVQVFDHHAHRQIIVRVSIGDHKKCTVLLPPYPKLTINQVA